MIGDVLLECELEPGERRTLAGFENHAGRTYLDDGAEPLGRVLAGFGNDGESGYEGCRVGRVRRHVPARPAPPAQPLARRLAARAGARAPTGGEPPELEPLADELEGEAHAVSAERRPRRAAAASRAPRARRGRPRGRPGVQRCRKRWIGGCRTISSSSSAPKSRWPRTAASCEVTCFERAAGQVAREDDVHDVLGREAARPARSSRRSRPGLRPAARRRSRPPRRARGAARRRGSRPSRRRRPAAASTPCRASRGGRAGCSPASAGSPRRGSAARPISARDEPKPRTPRSLSGSSSTSTGSSSGTGSTTSCAIRIPGSTTNGSRASVFSRTTRTSPR